MLLGLTYQLIRFVADLVLVRIRSDAQLRAEVLALRHQLRLLERRVGTPGWQPGDRILLAALSRLLPRSGWSALLPRPETLLRWHRDLVRHKWAAFRQRPPRQRPARDPERRECVLRLARENPGCRGTGEYHSSVNEFLGQAGSRQEANDALAADIDPAAHGQQGWDAVGVDVRALAPQWSAESSRSPTPTVR